MYWYLVLPLYNLNFLASYWNGISLKGDTHLQQRALFLASLWLRGWRGEVLELCRPLTLGAVSYLLPRRQRLEVSVSSMSETSKRIRDRPRTGRLG